MRIKELSTVIGKSITPSENENGKLMENNASLRMLLRSKSQEMERYEDALKAVKIEREQLCKELNSAKEQLNIKNNQITELENDYNPLKLKISDLSDKLKLSEKLVSSLINEKQSFKSMMQNKDHDIIVNTVINIQESNKKVEASVKLVEEYKNKAMISEESKKNLESKLIKIKVKRDEMGIIIEELQQKLKLTEVIYFIIDQKRIPEIEKKLEFEINENNKFKASVTELTKENQQLKETIAELEVEKISLINEIQELKNKVKFININSQKMPIIYPKN